MTFNGEGGREEKEKSHPRPRKRPSLTQVSAQRAIPTSRPLRNEIRTSVHAETTRHRGAIQLTKQSPSQRILGSLMNVLHRLKFLFFDVCKKQGKVSLSFSPRSFSRSSALTFSSRRQIHDPLPKVLSHHSPSQVMIEQTHPHHPSVPTHLSQKALSFSKILG